MYLSKTFFNIISLAVLAVVSVSAQDEGPGYVTKCTTPGQVALTFDDGPSPFTPKLLEYLKAAEVTATFFVLGKAVGEFGDTLKATFDAGHQIALHSNTHSDMNTLTPPAIEEEYVSNSKAVSAVIGKTPAMARPPFGNCNEACSKVLQGDLGLSIIQWNCDSNDWQYEANVADQGKTFTNIADIINPSNPKTDSFITLQHDIKDYSVEFVPKIIELIKGKGYTFVTVEQCTGLQAYKEGGDAAPEPAAADPAAEPAPEPAAEPAAQPAYVSAEDQKSEDPKDPKAAEDPKATEDPKAPENSAGKLSSSLGLTLVGLAFGLLY